MSEVSHSPTGSPAGSPIGDHLIHTYLDGELDADGIARLEQWLLADPARQLRFATAVRWDNHVRAAVNARLVRRSAGFDTARLRRIRRRPMMHAGVAPLAWAALLVITLGGIAWTTLAQRTALPTAGKNPPETHSVVTVTTSNGHVAYASIDTVYAGPCTITFSDASQLILDAAGKVRLNQLHEHITVTVLSGQAKAAISPQVNGSTVTLHTDFLEVTVIGTRFTVDTSPFATLVQVEEGRVRATDTKGLERLISRGEKAWAGRHGLAQHVRLVSPTGTTPQPGGYSDVYTASEAAKPGDLILLLPGQHVSTPTQAIRSRGTADKWITLTSYPGKRARVVPVSGDALRCIDASFLRISEIDFSPARPLTTTDLGSGITLQRSHHLQIDGCTVRYFGGDGISATQCDYLSLLGNRISTCGFTSPWGQGGINIYGSLAIDAAPGLHIDVSGNHVSGCRMTKPNATGGWEGCNGIGIYRQRPGDDGADYPGYAHDITIADNICADNDGAGISLYRVENITLQGNLLHYNAVGTGGVCELGLFSATQIHLRDNLIVPKPGIEAALADEQSLLPAPGTRVWGIAASGFEALTTSPYQTACVDEHLRRDFRTRFDFPAVRATPSEDAPRLSK